MGGNTREGVLAGLEWLTPPGAVSSLLLSPVSSAVDTQWGWRPSPLAQLSVPSFPCHTPGHSDRSLWGLYPGTLQGTPFNEIFSVMPQPCTKEQRCGPPNSRGKPACRISFFLDSTFIACGRKDPASRLKWRKGEGEFSLLLGLPKLLAPGWPRDSVVSTSSSQWLDQLRVAWRLDCQDSPHPEGASEVPGLLSWLGLNATVCPCPRTHRKDTQVADGRARIWTHTRLTPKPQLQGQFVSLQPDSWCYGGGRNGSPEWRYETFPECIHFLSEPITLPPHFHISIMGTSLPS